MSLPRKSEATKQSLCLRESVASRSLPAITLFLEMFPGSTSNVSFSPFTYINSRLPNAFADNSSCGITWKVHHILEQHHAKIHFFQTVILQFLLLLVSAAFLEVGDQTGSVLQKAIQEKEHRLEWWRKARSGFIHWGGVTSRD